jgi:signal transduction histidine kinase
VVASFAAVALAFTLGLAAAHTFVSRIRTAAAEITGDAAPTISSLSSMRSELRKLERAVGDHLAACAPGGCGPPAPRIAALEQDLRARWLAYRLLPAFPGEADLWPRVDAELERLGGLVRRTLDDAASGRRRERGPVLGDELARAFDRLDDAIARIVDADHASGLAVAARIDALARLSTVASIVLVVLTVALTVLAATLALWVVRRYERALRERADDLEQFAARVAHDVKGPLTSTTAALHVVRRLSPEPGRLAIERAQRGVKRVQRIVDDLLEFARAGALDARSAAADVHDVLEDVMGDLREVAAERGVEVRVEPTPRERVACSPGVLTSIVENLVRNAISHIGAAEVRVVEIRVVAGTGRGPVRIEVEDSGPGIPAALGERIFEPCVRGEEEGAGGSGLGLATVKRFVSAHGGRLGFRPRARRGTLFWLEMPRA